MVYGMRNITHASKQKASELIITNYLPNKLEQTSFIPKLIEDSLYAYA